METLFTPCFGLEVLFWSHIVPTSKVERKEVNCNHLVFGQGRVVVVVISAPYRFYPSMIEPKKVNYNHQNPNGWLGVSTRPRANISRPQTLSSIIDFQHMLINVLSAQDHASLNMGLFCLSWTQKIQPNHGKSK